MKEGPPKEKVELTKAEIQHQKDIKDAFTGHLPDNKIPKLEVKPEQKLKEEVAAAKPKGPQGPADPRTPAQKTDPEEAKAANKATADGVVGKKTSLPVKEGKGALIQKNSSNEANATAGPRDQTRSEAVAEVFANAHVAKRELTSKTVSSRNKPAPSAKELGIEGPFEKSLKTEGPEFAPEDKENTLA
jgi:hypothetical protein